MNARLAPSWELSTDHSASSYGQPVLVHRPTGEAYGPGDILKPYPSYGFMPAAEVARRLAKTDLNVGGRPRKTSSQQEGVSDKPSVKELGLTWKESARAQLLAEISRE